jgi:hypothetical protein
VHVTGFEPVHVPAWQVSACVQALLSLQGVPFAAAGFEQVPLAGSQVPTVWHWSLAVHVTGVPAWQAPLPLQVSAPLQALPSLHEVPLATAGNWQPPVGLQVSLVHALPSLQVSGGPAVQVPAWQVSAPLHTLPSPHELPFGIWV